MAAWGYEPRPRLHHRRRLVLGGLAWAGILALSLGMWVGIVYLIILAAS